MNTSAELVREDLDSLEAALPSAAVRFLPGHDQWVIGPGTKDVHVTPSSGRDRVTRKANPVIVGGWCAGLGCERVTSSLSRGWMSGRHVMSPSSRRPRDSPASSAATCT